MMHTTPLYTIKIWQNEYNLIPEIRQALPYQLAYALATNAGWYKVQVVDNIGIVVLEFKHDNLGAYDAVTQSLVDSMNAEMPGEDLVTRAQQASREA